MTSGYVRQPRIRTAWASFRQWRRSRPFWAGIFTLLSALALLYPPFASLKFGDVVITLKTLGGISALVIGVIMIVCAVSFWVRPEFRKAAGIVTLLLAVMAVATVNLGVPAHRHVARRHRCCARALLGARAAARPGTAG